MLIWITGLSGSGKSTIAKLLYAKIRQKHLNTVLLDGDEFRNILGNGLSYTLNDRLKNAKSISKMCQFLTNQNINVVCATMSLFKEIHLFNRENIKPYFEIFIECDIEELIRRDQKQIYTKAIKEGNNNVVGIDLPYDRPLNPDLIIDNNEMNQVDKKVDNILHLIKLEG